jgi:hypothetical protein
MVTVHSIGALLSVSACLWLRTAFAGSQHPRSQLLGAGEKAVVAEWPADALGRAQTIEQIRLRLVVNESSEARETLADRCERSDPVALARKMRARARPAPIPGT